MLIQLRTVVLSVSMAVLGCHAATDLDGADPDELSEASSSAALSETLTFSGSLSETGVSWKTHPFTIAETSDVTVTLSFAPSADMNVFLIDASGATVAFANGTVNNPETLTFEGAAPGSWSIGIKCKTGSGAYALSVELQGEAPSGMSVAGNQLLRDGAPFYPRGFNMIGVLTPDGCTGAPGAGLNARNAFGQAELLRARDAWHANTVRFQVSQRGLDPQDSLHSQAYVNRVLHGVTLARSLGLVVIASMQDQSIGCGSAHPLPFDATLRAWSTLAPLLAGDSGVMFELYNEPVTLETAAGWQQWRHGGSSPVTDNQGKAAVGHQAIVDHIRALGAPNVLIADGANKGGKLQNLYPGYLLADPQAPAAPQIVYAIHPYYFHTGNHTTLAQDRANWELRFGYITPHVPVLVTEWNASASCFEGQAARIPDLFAYLEAHSIGLLAHAFDVPGTMVQNLTSSTPTSFTGCASGSDAGALVQAHFAALASREPGPPPPPPALNVYFGNTHAHTGAFSGHGADDSVPDEHFASARANGYDFYCLTEHIGPGSPLSTPAFYQDLRTSAAAHTTPSFVGIAGFEYSENGGDGDSDSGHLNALNTSIGVNASAPGMGFATFFDWLAAEVAGSAIVASLNHPGAGGHASTPYLTPARSHAIALTEVFNSDISKGTDAANYTGMIRELDAGWRVAPTCGMDNHGLWNIAKAEPGSCRVGVLASSLTAAALVEGMLARRTFATRDYNLSLTYRVNGHLMGSTLPAGGTLSFAIVADDPDTGRAQDRITRLEIISESGQVVASSTFNAHRVEWNPTIPSSGRRWFLVRAFNGERTDLHIAVAAPVWLP